MKVLHVIPSLSPKHGGPSVALPLIARSLVKLGVTVDIATTDDDGPHGRFSHPGGQRIERDGYGVYYFAKQTEFYKASWPFHRWMGKHAGEYDLIHVHALFSFTSVCGAWHARRKRVPYVIRPLGVLNRYGMVQRRPLLKRISFAWVEKPLLRHASGMHYTSVQEQAEAEASGASARPFIVPLGLDLEDMGSPANSDAFLHLHPDLATREIVLFLSRLDAKKRVDRLLSAFALLKKKRPNARLVVAGSGETGFLADLKAQAQKLDIARDVLWLGYVEGEAKRQLLAAAQVYVLPSESENFGIAPVEAMAAGLPVVLTEGVAVAEHAHAARAGVLSSPAPEALASAMETLLNDGALRAEYSANGRKLVREKFSLQSMGKNLVKMYNAVGANSLPDLDPFPDHQPAA